jgi:dihydroorotate dehydrogenase (NAD+) catalytic subunit
MKPKLDVEISGIKLKNPILLASGTCGYGEEIAKIIDINLVGGIVTKGITLKPRKGNPLPRIYETNCGMINSIGLENVGIDAFIKDKLNYLKKFDTAIIVNVAGFNEEEFCKIVDKLNQAEGIDGIELNISCPNIKYKCAFSHDKSLVYTLVKKVKKVAKYPIIVKLSPDVTDITCIAKSAEDAGADAISLINTYPAMAINIETRKPIFSNIEGGLSGPCIKPIALRLVWKVYQSVKIPVIGIGGIMNAADAIEFIIAGASAVEVGTANFINPLVSLEIIKGIEEYLCNHKISDIKNLIGKLRIK